MITFSNKDFIDIQTPHDDSLVISVIVSNYEVRKVLMDNKSVADILCYDTFVRMKLPTNRLTPVQNPLYGFTKNVIMLKRTITFPMLMGVAPK